ncbi:MarR family winged helix-turn-helix transcriptional regulator [Micromonosporaceae bacterium Da 78-11]
MSATTPPGPALPDGLTPLTTEEEAVMRALGRVLLVMPRTLNAELEREQRMSLSEYNVLRHLSESHDRLMRMSELAQACDMSLSGMTRVAAKLESAGYLDRVKCENDARGWNAVLTEAGLARLRQAWPSHLASVRRHIFDHLDGLDLVKLAATFDRISGENPPL